ncbi:Septin-4 [Triplophysa tibetana]|uniref:Septin-7 n=1 Tax=Triplophysa tibetana TaxID=1572043 RepID=A0A5A9PD22_9TELE|nr:Septin-4 [Triplophysa tibetana]
MAVFQSENYARVGAMAGSPAGSSSSTAEAHDGEETVDFSQDPFFFCPLAAMKTDDVNDKSSFKPKSPQTQLDPFAILEEQEREYSGINNTRSNQDKEYVGVDTLLNQVHRNSLKSGFEFNLMVVGESGLGKSTLVNSLFLTNLYMDRHVYDVSEKITQTVSITKTAVEIVENEVKLKLNIVDTPGFGDALNNSKSWQAAVDYVDQQLEKYRRDEFGLNRKNMRDNRVHCCLYFISPHGHGLRPIDVSFMMALHEKVNIVPVLAKADSLTPTEIQDIKTQVRTEINKYNIQIFQSPECNLDSNDLRMQDLKEIIPFAVIGSNTIVESNGRRVRARVYPWGVVEVENPSHSDFVHLRNMLIRTHMQHLKDVTHQKLYENYRINYLCNNPHLISSLAINDCEDAEMAYTMRDLPPRAAHTFPGCEMPTMNREPDYSIRLQTPGTPTFTRPVSRSVPTSEIETPRRGQLSSMSSLESPVSPFRPKSPWSRFDPYDSAEDQDKEYVGFATLPNQVHRKSVKKGFAFTLMVAGESGLGKSTLVNSLFLTDLYKDRKMLNAEERIMQTKEITKHTLSIEEKGVKLRLTIVDTPGFGDAVDNTESWKPVADYIDEQFEQYFRDESGLNRKNIQDNRVHCCLYFISPFGHGLRPMDVEFMKALHEKVNIVPVLAKADSMTPVEVQKMKLKICEDIERFGISVYQFSECDSDEDEELKLPHQELKDSIPFTVIGSNILVESQGRRFRGRQYPWGVVEVENPTHSDFLKLRNMLVRTHMQDLKDVTRETHYENYRAQSIQNMTRMVMRERKRSLCDQLRDSTSDLPVPVVPLDSETERLIWEKDAELRQMQEVLQKIQEQMHHGH